MPTLSSAIMLLAQDGGNCLKLSQLWVTDITVLLGNLLENAIIPPDYKWQNT